MNDCTDGGAFVAANGTGAAHTIVSGELQNLDFASLSFPLTCFSTFFFVMPSGKRL